ncbi:conserved protein of unknown function [Nitratireductor aquimarinus]|uniref:hypothetical protein n=1 Tax=Nitratireductor aquimarinus TaxID=889300 RepID=UPI003B5B2F71
MSNIVSFPSRDQDQVVWRCNCGCLTNFLRADGGLECAQCGELASADYGEWRKRFPDTPASPKEQGAGDIKVTDLNSPKQAVKRALLNADCDTLAALVLLHSDGAMTVWGEHLDTDERAEWFDRRMADAKALLTPKGTNDGS